MESRPDAMRPGKVSAMLKLTDNGLCVGKFLRAITDCGMGFDRHDGAEDAKGADFVGDTELQGSKEGTGIMLAELGQARELIPARQALQGCGGGDAEFDGLLKKLATQTKPKGIGAGDVFFNF